MNMDCKMIFLGTFVNFPKDANYGDVFHCLYDNCTYVYVNNEWVNIYSTEDLYSDNNQYDYPTNCRNCGAVLHNHICEFCGTDNRR